MHSMGATKRLQAVEAKVERHGYIREKFPMLTNLSLKDLWFTCMYQGQLSLRETDTHTANQTLAYLENILVNHPWKNGNESIKEKVWLTMARISFPFVCKLRNTLKIGL